MISIYQLVYTKVEQDKRHTFTRAHKKQPKEMAISKSIKFNVKTNVMSTLDEIVLLCNSKALKYSNVDYHEATERLTDC